MKKLAPLALVLSPLLGFLWPASPAQQARLSGAKLPRLAVPPSLTLCDSYGKKWLLSFAVDPTVEGGYTVTGLDDLEQTLSCSNTPLPVYGSLVGRVLSITTFDDPDSLDGCVSVHWQGTFFTDFGLTGTWMNETLSLGRFTFQVCSVEHGRAYHAAVAAGQVPPNVG